MLRRALALCVCLPLAGCVFGPGRTGPEGLSGYDTDLRSIARQEDFDRALELTEEGADDAGDDLLRVLHRAALLRYDGQYEESNRLLQEAALEIDDRYTKSISRAAFSMLTNDRALAYNPPSFERMMLHYYGALNYLALDDPEEAAVEARLLSSLLMADSDKQLDDRDIRIRRSLHYFAGAVFETAGEWNAAGVAYRNAWDGWDRTPGVPEPDVAAMPDSGFAREIGTDAVPDQEIRVNSDLASGIEVDSSLARGLEALTPAFIARDRAPTSDSGEVILVLETGFVAHRIERAVAVPIFSNDASSLKEGADASRHNAGLCVAARALGPQAAIDTDDCAQPGGRSLFVLTVAWPEMRRSSEPVRGARITARTGSGTAASLLTVPPALTIDLSTAAMSEYDSRIGGIVAKAIARATTKYLIVQAAKEGVKKENETAGLLVGLLGNAAAVASERADIRSWHLLPGTIRIARMSLPAGVHSIELDLDGLQQTKPLRMDLGEVSVRPGSVTILPIRSWP